MYALLLDDGADHASAQVAHLTWNDVVGTRHGCICDGV